MIRNLKILIAAAMALSAFGVISASGAQAAEFHCSVEPCRYTVLTDGTGKTAHHVFELKNGAGETTAITCPGITGEGTSATRTTTELTVAVKYDEPCKFAGSEAAFVKMNECVYKFKANGEVAVSCPAGKVIEFGIAGCIGTVGSQAGLKEVTFHTIGSEATTTTEVTVETHVKGIAVTKVDGTKAGCGGWDPTVGTITGEYTTGNAIVTGETDPGGVMANIWWT